MKQNNYCFLLQSNADHQRSKNPIREFRFTELFVVEKVFRMKITTFKAQLIKTRILPCITLRKSEPKTVLQDRKEICNLMMKLLYQRTTYMSSRGEQMLESFPIVAEIIRFQHLLMTRTLLMPSRIVLAFRMNFSPTWIFCPPGHIKMKIMLRLENTLRTLR